LEYEVFKALVIVQTRIEGLEEGFDIIPKFLALDEKTKLETREVHLHENVID
jgi:hypothetical protein